MEQSPAPTPDDLQLQQRDQLMANIADSGIPSWIMDLYEGPQVCPIPDMELVPDPKFVSKQ